MNTSVGVGQVKFLFVLDGGTVGGFALGATRCGDASPSPAAWLS